MSTVTASASDAVLISPTQLQALQAAEPVVLIDTRDADTYALGHIPGAVNLRETFTYLATSTPQGLQELKDTFAAHLGAIGLSGAETAVADWTGSIMEEHPVEWHSGPEAMLGALHAAIRNVVAPRPSRRKAST